MGKGKWYVSAKDLLGGEPDPYTYTGFYGVLEYSWPKYWHPEGCGVECGCTKCEARREREATEADKM